jgi:outer membrane murein-binding lipoprotein Lpp
MSAKRKIGFFLILSATLMLAGCPSVQKTDKAPLKPNAARQQDDTMSKRFQETSSGSQSAVDSAIKLAQEHAVLSEKMTVMQQKNQELSAQNVQLKEKVASLEPELIRTKKELADTNDLLIEMRIELNNWKENVLGFREEMREADKVQLKTLLKILEILGGEVKPAPGQAGKTESSPRQDNPKPKEKNTSGEPNE